MIHISLPAAAILHIHTLQLDSSMAFTPLMPWLLVGGAWLFFHLIGRLLALPDADLADAAAESARTRTELGLYERPEGADTEAGEGEA